MQQADAYAKEKDGECELPVLKHTITIVHGDGSLLHLKNAYVELKQATKYGSERSYWIVVFAEHFKPMVFHNEDVEVAMVLTGNGPQDLLAEGIDI